MSSPLVNIELQTWKIDCVVSLGMAVAFLLPIIVPFAWFQRLTPYLDQIITIILSAFMLPTPIKTVITGLRDLMLWPPEAETVDDIKAYSVIDVQLTFFQILNQLWLCDVSYKV